MPVLTRTCYKFFSTILTFAMKYVESINVLANVSVFLPTLKDPERISRIQQNNGSIYHPFFRDILLLKGKNFHSSFFFPLPSLEMNKNVHSPRERNIYFFFSYFSDFSHFTFIYRRDDREISIKKTREALYFRETL